jgi:formylglycine-generating enzyme required for sulfatase activity/energy-coupling factor transporter ATP-binding protein EcfA2
MATFLSYSAVNSDIAAAIEAQLRAAGVVVYRDREQMRGGGNWKDELLPLIDRSEHFVLVWSEDAARSRPVAAELGRALAADRRILPVLTSDAPPLPLSLGDHHVFQLGPNGQGIEQVVRAIVPYKSSDRGFDPHTFHAATVSYRSQLIEQLSGFQVLYPGETRRIDSIVALGITEGYDVQSMPASDTGMTATDLLKMDGSGRELILLAGQPGSGKSTTLRLLAYRMCMVTGGSLPITLRCADYRPERHPSFDEFVFDGLRSQVNREIVDTLREGGLLRCAPVTLLIDGLDELSVGVDDNFFAALRDYIDSRDASYVAVFASSRTDYLRLSEDKFLGWKRYTIRPLSPAQVQSFVTNWFKDPDVAQRFLANIRDPRLGELASRPFLLTMMCLVFERGGELGPNRSELYAKAVHYLEYRHSTSTSERTIELRHRVLCELALRGLQLGLVELDRRVAAGFTAVCMSDNGVDISEFRDIDTYLETSSREVGILQSSSGRYSFVHRTFQEYLAARQLIQSRDGDGLLLENAMVPRWEESIRLYVGLLTDPRQQAATLQRLWTKNQALTLRALTDATLLPGDYAQHLLGSGSADDRVRMLQSMPESLIDLDEDTRKRIVLETVVPLLRVETDSRVLYHAIELARSVDPSDESGALWNSLGRHSRGLRETLLREPAYRFALATLPRGTFTMGDDHSQDEIERPAHRVSLSPFSIGIWQPTNLAYELVTGRPPTNRANIAQDNAHPVVGISWFDAYVAALRIGCRLPTEAEWEYAARAGTTTAWSFGDDESQLPLYAAYEGSPVQHGRPWAVGSGRPNPWGLYDVHGNVWEWCADWLAPYPTEPQVDPMGPVLGEARVRRGGGHSYHARGCRSAFRWGNDPTYSFRDIGMRLVLDERAVAKGW